MRSSAALDPSNQALGGPEQPWTQVINNWVYPSSYLLQVDETHVSITVLRVLALTDLYPLIRCCLNFSPFPHGSPPNLIYGTRPWTDDNHYTALEFFFKSNAYHPHASCDKCGHRRSVPMAVLARQASIAPPPLHCALCTGNETLALALATRLGRDDASAASTAPRTSWSRRGSAFSSP